MNVQAEVAEVALAGEAADISAWQGMGPDKETDERLAILEKNVRDLIEKADRYQKDLKQAKQTASKELEQERTARAKADKDIRRLVDEVSVGGLRLEGFGLVMLVTGILLTTLAPDMPSTSALQMLHTLSD